jgi:hypothetical protein
MTKQEVEQAILDYTDAEYVAKIEIVVDGHHPTAWAARVTTHDGDTWDALVNADGDGEVEEVEFTTWPPSRGGY